MLFGGKPLSSEGAEKIPAVYGAWEPTAVFVPLKEMLRSPETFALCTTEIFGPFQVWGTSLPLLSRMGCFTYIDRLLAPLLAFWRRL